MDFDELKSVWKKAHDQEKAGYWVSEEDMKAMIHKKSRATIADVARQVKRKIRMTGIIGSMTLLFSLGILFTRPDEPDFFLWLNGLQYSVMMLFMTGVMTVIHFHSRWRLKQINEVERSSASLKEAVSKTHFLFQRVINTGVLSDTIATPMVLLLVAGIALYGEQPFAFDYRLLLMLGIAVAGVFVFYRLGRFLLMRRIGFFLNHLEQRKHELEELEADEE